MGTYIIKFVNQDPMPVYCDNKCTGVCYVASTRRTDSSDLEIMKKGSCYRIFSIKHNFATDLKQVKIVNQKQCMVAGIVEYKGNHRVTMIALDSGAMCNVVSETKLCEIFQQESMHGQDLTPTGVELKTADDSALECIGQITMNIKIGRNEATLLFFVINSGSVFLLGVPAITKLNVIIDLPNSRCYLLEYGERDKFVNNVTVCEEKQENPAPRLRQTLPKSRTNRCSENCVVRLTPAKRYSINDLEPIRIKLEVLGEIKPGFIYKKLAIFDCTCLLEEDRLCMACATSSYHVSAPARVFQNRLFVSATYTPQILEDLSPNVHFFAGIFNIKVSKLKKEIASVNFIEEIEPPGYTWDGENIGFDNGGFPRENILCQNEEMPEGKPKNDYLEKNGVCRNCVNKGQSYFCDVTDKECINVTEFRSRVLNSDLKNVKCTVKIQQKETYCKMEDHAVWIYFAGNCSYGYKKWMLENFPFWHKQINQSVTQKRCSLTPYQSRKYWKFLISGKNPAFLELVEILGQIGDLCQKYHIRNIFFCNFQALMISQNAIKRCFKDFSIKINLVNILTVNEAGMQQNEGAWKKESSSVTQHREKIAGDRSVYKIKFSSTVKGDAVENNPRDQVNIMTDSVEYREKFKLLVDEMDKIELPVKSLWAKSNNDIGLLTSGSPRYNVIEFDFPIKDNANLTPLPIKQHFLQANLVPAASEMLQALCDLGIIARGYSVFDAATFFIPKQRKELSLTKYLQQGGKKENFVPGTPDKTAPQNLRMVNHFESLNNACYNNPVIQQSTSQQLKRITTQIKFVSVIDVCAAFHSLKLSKEAQNLTGFSPQVTGWPGRMFYKRVPMGAKPSKNLLDNALFYVLAGINEVSLYSDNILVLSQSEQEHFQSVREVWNKLRDHGLKVKASKCVLMASDRVKLYGMVIDLRTGRLYPEMEKIEGLKNRPIPQSRKQLKQFLGSLIFLSQLTPIAAENIALLHQCTRGKTFTFGERHKETYENIQYLLSDSNLLFVYRPDPARRFYIIVDSSLFHTGWVLFQLCPRGHPRVLSYNCKTWGEQYTKYIAALRELMGILAALQNTQRELEHSEKGVTLYTDSLPIVLCAVQKQINAKIARYFIFLSSLSWVELSFAPGKSNIMKMADFFSRQYLDAPKYRLKMPTECDLEKCRLLDSKLNKSNCYTAAKSMYIIDRLANESDETLCDMKPGSYEINDEGEICYVSIGSKQIVRSISSKNPLSVISLQGPNCSETGADAYSVYTVRSCGDIYDTESDNEEEAKVEENEYVDTKGRTRLRIQNEGDEIRDIADLGWKKRQKIRLRHITEPKNGQIQELEALIRTRNVPLAGDAAEEIIWSPEKDDKDSSGDTVDAEQQESDVEKHTFDQYYRNLRGIAKYLDIKHLSSAQRFDPFWKSFIDKLDIQEVLEYQDKIFFMANDTLFCEENIQGLVNYKIVIPDLLALDLVVQSHRHYACIRGKKLLNQLNAVFEIRNVAELVNRVCEECYNCSLIQRQPCGKNRPPLPKHPKMLREKCEVWAIDELQLVSPETGKKVGFFKIICAVDLFSNFCVIDTVKNNLDAKQVLDFIQLKIVSVFGLPRALVSDNASCMNNQLVSQSCALLNIHYTTISPYSAKSNLQELLNRMLLDCLRALTHTHYSSPSVALQIIGPVTNLVNSLTFQELKNVSPYFLQFAKKPKVDLLVFHEDDPMLKASKESYVENIIRINSVLTKIRLAQINCRKYLPPSKHTQSYQNRIEVGSIVSIQNPELIVKKENFKLRPRFKNRFLVTEKTQSSVVLVPCAEIFLEDYFRKHKTTSEDYTLRIKADISNVKILTNTLLVNSNRKENFYKNFFESNCLPPTFYISQDDGRTMIRRLEELDPQPEAEDLQFYVNLIRKLQNRQKAPNVSILISPRQQKINNIVQHLKPIAKNKQVRFDSKVTELKLIAPSEVYHCLFPKCIALKDTFDPPIRKLENNIWCICRRCRLLLPGCSKTSACDNCFGSGK